MDTLKEIEEKLLKKGFKKNENSYIFENVSYDSMYVNGREMRREHKSTLELIYCGVGGYVDDSDICSDDIFFFDIKQDGELSASVGVYDYQELFTLLNIK